MGIMHCITHGVNTACRPTIEYKNYKPSVHQCMHSALSMPVSELDNVQLCVHVQCDVRICASAAAPSTATGGAVLGSLANRVRTLCNIRTASMQPKQTDRVGEQRRKSGTERARSVEIYTHPWTPQA